MDSIRENGIIFTRLLISETNSIIFSFDILRNEEIPNASFTSCSVRIFCAINNSPIQFMTAGTNVVSASGNIHVIVAEQVDGKWLIIRDDPGQIEGYINDAFHKFRSECPHSDEKEIETYIMDRFATWGNDPLPPYTITG